jgi:hypothetical protein
MEANFLAIVGAMAFELLTLSIDLYSTIKGLKYIKGGMGNMESYRAFEVMSVAAFGSTINEWRRSTLQLRKLSYVGGISAAIVDSKIPFSAMWSPSFVPKPADWPEQCRVVGVRDN